MAVHFKTEKPNELLSAFESRINQSELKDKIVTWQKIADGVHYTHVAKDWTRKAFFKPKVENQVLTFNIIRGANTSVSAIAYAYYHGHLIETFLNHFDSRFTEAYCSAMPEAGDNCLAPQ